jgi:hypothetical protein
MTEAGRRGLAAAVSVLLAGGAAGCKQDCCTVDSAPIPLARAPLGGPAAGDGALLARARLADTTAMFSMVVDTASPLTVLTGSTISTTPGSRGFDLLDALWPENDPLPVPVRAKFRDIGVFSLPVGPAGDATTLPLGVLGGDVLRSFSVELRFETCGDPTVDAGATSTRCSAMTLWPHQGASLGFLSTAGYATLRFTTLGGGETTARASSDTFGIRAPVTLPATRIILRACAAPKPFSVMDPVQICCKRGDEVLPTNNSGLDLALVLATGTGPLVLSQSAWKRLLPKLPTAPPPLTDGKLLIPSWPAPIDATWSTIPRLALVDLESSPASDPGPCVELSRARRIQWAANQQAMSSDSAACVQPCDTDPNEPSLAQNSAAYVELGGAIPVAVIKDDEELLQSLRFDVRPLGPEIDGLIGAGALTPTRVELDYVADPKRAIFSCELGTEAVCFATSRCPRLPDHSQKHTCFGLPQPIGLPKTCAPSGCP